MSSIQSQTKSILVCLNKCLQSDYKVDKDNIPEKKDWITETIAGLVPSCDYDIRLRATNQRPEMPYYSDYVSMVARTIGKKRFSLISNIILLILMCKTTRFNTRKYFCIHHLISDSPRVVLKDLEVTRTRMWIFWEYSTSNAKSKRNEYHFYVQIQYRKTSQREYRTGGIKISAEQVLL